MVQKELSGETCEEPVSAVEIQ
uniref:Uncharacterized protein n=1 Tax=Anguilla anguilla TaxID=7936 RepID=A0A0E9SI56_ANGAN